MTSFPLFVLTLWTPEYADWRTMLETVITDQSLAPGRFSPLEPEALVGFGFDLHVVTRGGDEAISSHTDLGRDVRASRDAVEAARPVTSRDEYPAWVVAGAQDLGPGRRVERGLPPYVHIELPHHIPHGRFYCEVVGHGRHGDKGYAWSPVEDPLYPSRLRLDEPVDLRPRGGLCGEPETHLVSVHRPVLVAGPAVEPVVSTRRHLMEP